MVILKVVIVFMKDHLKNPIAANYAITSADCRVF